MTIINQIKQYQIDHLHMTGEPAKVLTITQNGYIQLLQELKENKSLSDIQKKTDVDHFDGMRIEIVGQYYGECRH